MLLSVIAIVAATGILFLSAFLALEVMGAYLAMARDLRYGERTEAPGAIAVVIPAHNERDMIGAVIKTLKQELRKGDRLLVVADNCVDDTAAVARAAGAEALERHDAEKRGKGHALQFGVDALRAAPPQTVVFVDADCMVEPGVLARLAERAEATGQPVQGLYLMNAGEGAHARQKMAAFAWAFMNQVRMSGLDRLYGVTRLTGSGMALPWQLAQSLHFGGGEIVEDIALTLALTEQGAPPILARDAIVRSAFPDRADEIVRQRARWEHGTRRLAMRRIVPCFIKGAMRGDIRLMALCVDLAIPPLINFFVICAGAAALTFVVALFGAGAAFSLSLTALLLIVLSVIAAWIGFGRSILPLSAIGGLAPFAAEKLRIYSKAGRGSAKGWSPTRGGGDKRE